MASELLLPTARATDADSNVYAGAKWIFYATGTTTPQAVFADADLSDSLGHIVTADSGGRFVPIYMDAALSYRGICENSSGSTTLHDIDPINSDIFSVAQTFIDNLADDGGSGEVGFIQVGTGAVARTQQAKDRDTVSVADFGAVGDGITDDKNAIQAALDSGATRIILTSRMPVATYRVSGTLTVPSNMEIVGDSRYLSRIESTDLDAPILSASSEANIDITNLHLRYSGTPVAGAKAISLTDCQTCSVRNLWVGSSWDGIYLEGGGNHSIIDYRCYLYENTALQLVDCIDVNLTSFRFTAGDSIKGRDAGIALFGAVEAFTASQGDITLGASHAVSLNGTSAARGDAPFYNKFSQVFCDSTKDVPIFLRFASHTTFMDCWASSAGHDEAVGFGSALDVPGVDIATCSFTKFIGGELYNNGGAGARVFADNTFTLFDGMSVKRNQFSRASNGAGIQILSNTNDFMVRDCLFERDADTVTYRMTLAVEVLGGTSDRYNIADNLLGGTSVADNGTGVNKRVANNY